MQPAHAGCTAYDSIQLNLLVDVQGRARPSLARLYNWRYTGLGDLPNVSAQPEYLRANPGMAYEYQLLDVGDAEESAPLPYFYQVGDGSES